MSTGPYLDGVSTAYTLSTSFPEITKSNESLNESNGSSTTASNGVDDVSAQTVVKATILVIIITSAVVGNTLVIISVARFDKLRIMANTFIVSLATADLLVAVLVMPFNASQEIAERWLFTEFICDLFNANDVLFCTASLLHLCCISMDRYIAITDPFGYDRRMTHRRVAITLAVVWTASTLLSHVPVHSQWYVDEKHPKSVENGTCFFMVNMPYGIVSSSVSFWTPALVMVFTYIKIYREAQRQEKLIEAMTHIHGRHSTAGGDQSLPVTRTVSGQGVGIAGGGGDGKAVGLDRGARAGSAGDRGYVQNGDEGVQVKNCLDEKTRRLTSEGRKMKREHKAAKTLGIIMGAFLVCWLPFFTWYLTDSICQDRCKVPQVYISALFWIGYTNSALNPVIYACFNRDFRFAFKKLLGCCTLFGRSQHQYITTSERTALKMSPIARNGISKV